MRLASEIAESRILLKELKLVNFSPEESVMTILLIILILLLVGAFPAWPYSRSWGYYPSGGLGLIVVILVILLLMHVV
ncbi:MAG: DUF3309 domain-containing protein [Silvibacterium sp.]